MGADGIEIRAAIERLLMPNWDPIGVADQTAARDEYRAYAMALDGMLMRGADAALFASALLRFEREAMALRGMRRGPNAWLPLLWP